MQDRFTGDIRDYGKFILLRSLAAGDLRLAIVWCLDRYGGGGTDGKFTEYLDAAKEKHFRLANPNIYDGLREIVINGDRRVSLIEEKGILPKDTIFYDAPFDYLMFRSAGDKKSSREAWVSNAINETKGADLVFFDPDNGLDVKSHPAHTKLGAKYIFENEIRAFLQRNQSIVVYQHMNRSECVENQARRALHRLTSFAEEREGWVITFRSYSVRLYLILPSASHISDFRKRTDDLMSSPCQRIFNLKCIAE